MFFFCLLLRCFFFLLLVIRRRQQIEIGMRTVDRDQLYLWVSGEYLLGICVLYMLCDNDDDEEKVCNYK
jgi:hypothetical protein